jgi:signal transduction histidine kinase
MPPDDQPTPPQADHETGALSLDRMTAAWLTATIAEGEDWLIQRTLLYATRYGYTRYTSTLAEAWRASIQGLSERLLICVGEAVLIPVDADHDHRHDSLAEFGIAEARKHRARGVTLGLFLGLMKYYRRAYVDRVGEAPGPREREPARQFVEAFFDRVEVALATEWSERSEGDKLGELREGNRRIINEKNRYLTIFESVDEPVIVLDEAGGIAAVNHSAAHRFTGAELPGAFYYSNRRPQWLDGQIEAILADTGARGPFEVELATAQGPCCFDVRVERMLDVSHKFGGVVVLFSDVTLRKQAEAVLSNSARALEHVVAERTADLQRMVDELTRSNKDLERFAYVASHDLQEPLRSIASFAQLLGNRYRGRLDADADEFIGYVVDGAKRMSALISDLLAYGDAESRAEPLAGVAADDALDDARDALAAIIRENDAEIVAETLPVVAADRMQLVQLFQVLLSNAVKFRRAGQQPRITVTAVTDETMARFSIVDNGIGIAPDQCDSVFLPFKRLHSHHEYPGTGIGLALARRIVERHGGTITAEPVVGDCFSAVPAGGGTRIVFTLPLEPPKQDP